MMALKSPLSSAFVGAAAAGLLLAVCLSPSVSLAQSGSKPEPERTDPKTPPPEIGKALSKTPQTADEKTKILNDLYAYLATAEDEESAKPIAEAIERLWSQSGSDTITLLMDRSSTALSAKNPELALKLLDSVVTLAPDYAEGFNRRAYIRFTQNNVEAAVGDLRRVLALEPNHFKALDGLGQIWREHGNKRGALSVFKHLLEVHPYWPGAKQAVEELSREVEGQGI
ncbi:MAG TPA: tetratricopeptide repeat protein [Hyphomicrobiaceae bacterium]|nr:tetratricopeptide repeat protein [Hyphomicrobiaceae bacterium]